MSVCVYVMTVSMSIPYIQWLHLLLPLHEDISLLEPSALDSDLWTPSDLIAMERTYMTHTTYYMYTCFRILYILYMYVCMYPYIDFCTIHGYYRYCLESALAAIATCHLTWSVVRA